MARGVGNIVMSIVIILVSLLVSFQVFETIKAMMNLTGLWATTVNIMEVAIPAFFIFTTIYTFFGKNQ